MYWKNLERIILLMVNMRKLSGLTSKATSSNGVCDNNSFLSGFVLIFSVSRKHKLSASIKTKINMVYIKTFVFLGVHVSTDPQVSIGTRYC